MATRRRGKNYKPIEALAALASFLHVEETGDSLKTSLRDEMCAEEYLRHIDLLVGGKEMDLSNNASFPWPEWPSDVSVEDAKKRAERPDRIWSKGQEVARDCRKYEAILENKKQQNGGRFPSGWTAPDYIHYLRTTLWEMQEEVRSNAVNLVDDENTPPANTSGQHTGKKPRKKLPMPSNWPGPLSFLAWRKFGRLGNAHEYICSEKGDGPLLRGYDQNSAPQEPRSIVKVEDKNKESVTKFPVNSHPFAHNKTGKSRKAIREAGHPVKSHEQSDTEDDSQQVCRLLMSIQADIQVHNALDLYKIKLKQAKEMARIQPTAENKQNYYDLLSHPPALDISSPAGDQLTEIKEAKRKQPEPDVQEMRDKRT
jgi:hypothetical protein